MSGNQQEPSWLPPFFCITLMAGLLFLESRLPWSEGTHRAVEIGIVLCGYYLVWLWLQINEAALMQAERRKRQATLRAMLERSVQQQNPATWPARKGHRKHPGPTTLESLTGWLSALVSAVSSFFHL